MVTTKKSKKSAATKAAPAKRTAKSSSAAKSKTTTSAAKKTAAKKAPAAKATATKSAAKGSTTKRASKPKAAATTTKKKSTTRTATAARAAKAKAGGAATKTKAAPAPVAEVGWTPDAEVTFTPDWESPSEDQLKKIKSGLKKRDLDSFRSLLIEKRAEVIGDVLALEGDALGEAGNLSHMPLHMADIGSDNYEQEFSLNLAQSERKMLNEINEALVRIDQGIYGVCLYSGRPIGKPRLEAKPWAKYSIEVVRELEKRGRM